MSRYPSEVMAHPDLGSSLDQLGPAVFNAMLAHIFLELDELQTIIYSLREQLAKEDE